MLMPASIAVLLQGPQPGVSKPENLYVPCCGTGEPAAAAFNSSRVCGVSSAGAGPVSMAQMLGMTFSGLQTKGFPLVHSQADVL